MINWLKKSFTNTPGMYPVTITIDPANVSLAQSSLLDNCISYKNLGDVCLNDCKFEEAAQYFRKAIAINPNYAEAHNRLGNALNALDNHAEAVVCYQKAIALKPDYAGAICNMGNMLHDEGKLGEAVACHQKAISLQPDLVNAHYNLGVIFMYQNIRDKAIACFRNVLKFDDEHYTAKMNLLNQMQHVCDWGGNFEVDIQDVRREVREAPVTPKNQVSPFSFLALPGTTAAEQRRCAEKWVLDQYQPLNSLRRKFGFEFKHIPNDKISVGYLSADFHDHATARLMAEVFELHDRSDFQITAFSYGPNDGSGMRKRLENTFDQFVDIKEDSHENSAKKIYASQIDILVDLKGFTQNSRTGILALRPAPIQVNFLGYPGTTGTNFADYLIADQFIIPPEQFVNYTEKVVWMPDCYQPTDSTRLRLEAPTRRECDLPEEGLVFCCFNQTYKITPEVFDVWCRLLKAVPDSILWLLESNPHAEDNLKREAESRGVDKGRLVMAQRLAPEVHLARMQCADLFLDTIPVNAHTTCSDALWMGLPVITCVGDTFPSRVAGSLLSAINVPELISYHLEDYFHLALSLATDKKKRESIRNKIIANRDTTPLFDSERFTRNLEDVYTNMMSEYKNNPHICI